MDLPDFPRKRNHEHSGTSFNPEPSLNKYYIKGTVSGILSDFPSKGVNGLLLIHLYLILNVEVFNLKIHSCRESRIENNQLSML